METDQLKNELTAHKQKLGDLLLRQHKLNQIIKPHLAELKLLEADLSYESGISDMLEAIINMGIQSQTDNITQTTNEE